MILSWITSILASPILSKISDYLIQRSNTELGKYQGDVAVATAAIQAEIAARNAQKEIIIAEQGNWLTRSVRPMFAYPFIIYCWKFVVWDKVLGHWTNGTTDALGGLDQWVAVIIMSYFGVSAAENIAGKIIRGLRGR